MPTIKSQYDTDGVAITITLASLATGAARESASVDNSSNLYLDALVQLKIKLQSGTPGSDKRVYVYAAGTADGGTTWPDAVTGADAAITLNSPTQLKLIGVIEAPTSAGTFISEPMSVAQAFGGILPKKWSIIVQNMTNMTFSATEGDHTKKYQGIWAQSV